MQFELFYWGTWYRIKPTEVDQLKRDITRNDLRVIISVLRTGAESDNRNHKNNYGQVVFGVVHDLVFSALIF
jgi:hypothetical protein